MQFSALDKVGLYVFEGALKVQKQYVMSRFTLLPSFLYYYHSFSNIKVNVTEHADRPITGISPPHLPFVLESTY